MSTQMSTQTGLTTAPTPWSVDEWRTLIALRTRYQQTRDLFGATELARLRFVRWLYCTGRLVP
jgi:hypothetical protein